LVSGANFGKGVFTNLTPLTESSRSRPTGCRFSSRSLRPACIEAIEAQAKI
jgi:hypothetical protein